MSGCPLCDAQLTRDEMFVHLRETHPDDNWGEFSSLGDGPQTAHGTILIGTGRRIAYALSIWPLETAPRALIRAMLPEVGRARRSVTTLNTESRTSLKFKTNLYDMEAAGLIERGQKYIRILDRNALRERAIRGTSEDRIAFLQIERAVKPARAAVAEARAEAAKRQALRDLQAVYDLMKADLGTFHSGRGSVRHVPPGWRGRPS